MGARIRSLFLGTAIALTITGCQWWKVGDLIAETNALIVESRAQTESLILQSSVNREVGLTADPDSNLPPRFSAISEIEQYISEHPEEERANAALRIRQAILFLNANQPNSAGAAFAKVDPSKLSSGRDQALYEMRDTLIWWFRTARMPALPKKTVEDAKKHLDTLAQVGDGLPRKDGELPGIRYYVEQMRVRIALKTADAMVDSASAQERGLDGIQRYVQTFDASDQSQIRNLCLGQNLESVEIDKVRWFATAPAVFHDTRTLFETVLEEPSPLPAWTDGIDAKTCNA